MAWFGESSKGQEKNDMESLGIRFEPIVFYPDRNEYELCIDLSDCPKELVKATYEMGKLKVEGQKYQREFVQEFSIPADCVATGIYGQYEQGEVLHIIIPRSLSDWLHSEDASSKQAEDDRKATTEVGDQNRDEVKDLARGIKRSNSSSRQEDDVNASFDRGKLIGRLPTTLSSDQKSTDDVKERRGKDKLTARVPARVQSNQKATEDVNERGGKELDKLPSRVSAPSSSDHKETKKGEEKYGYRLLSRVRTLLFSDQKEMKGKDYDKLPTTVSMPLSSDQKEMKEKEGKDCDKLFIRIPTLPYSDQKENKEKDYDKLPTRVPAPLSSDQKEMKEKEGKDRHKLLARVPVPSPSPSDPKSTEKLRRRESKPFSKTSVASLPAPERSCSLKKPGENYQRNLSKTIAPPPPPPPHAEAMTPWNQKATKNRQEEEEDQKPSSTVVPTSPSSDQKKFKQNDVESNKPVIDSQKNDKKLELENAKDKEQSKVKKPSGDRGNKMLGLVAKVKETGKAAVSAARKEENRLVIMIGAVVLTIVVVGASWRRKKNQKIINM